ncbi:MAG: metal-binding protein [Lachnospiraceae bacterium]|nr:metal-binding protein [Lachnospiraceae bacterium]
MENSYRYFRNTECKYYPCHEGIEDINCLFCYCPLYHMESCPGNSQYLEVEGKKIKVCTDCTFPHKPENYDVIMKRLRQE